MEERYRWFSVSPLRRAQIEKIATVMKSRPYGRSVTSGFTLVTVRAELIEGAFTERLEYVEKLFDPLGGEVSVPRVEFRRTEFRITVNHPQLELRNPARPVRSLLNYIADALDFEVAVMPLSSPPLKWAKAIAAMGIPVQVFGIKSGKFSLSNEVHAWVSISGTTDVRKLMGSLVGDRVVEADTAVCGWHADDGEWRVELRSGGCARVLSAPGERQIATLRKALASFPAAES